MRVRCSSGNRRCSYDVNFYKHHIGDYAAATAHLSFVEDAAYSRLLRIYYRDERALPIEPKAVQRLAGARSKDEREAVQTVLIEFFVLADDGWHSKRCDEEIARANLQADTNRRIAEEREAAKRERSRQRIEHEALHEASNDSSATREPSQTPDTRLHQEKKAGAARGTRLPLDWQPSEEHKAYAEAHQVDWRKEVEAFKDWWSAAAGSKGVKLDWDATWRTWVRRAPKAAAPLTPAVPRKPAGPSETPLEKAISYARQQHGYGAIDVVERDRLIAVATEKHREAQTA